MMTLIRKALTIGLLLSLGSVLAAAEPALETVLTMRSKMAKAWDSRPVHVRGVVTYASSSIGVAFVQDATAGVAFFPRGIKGPRQLKTWETVELIGVPMMRDGTLM